MPQMSPMWWSSLFIMFLMTFMMMIMIIYFYNIQKSLFKKINKLQKFSLNWKW